ncbi:MAG TPA: carboxypeptidase regulatory-like domain-containing protein [Pyrinomonadaceae bacterium]|nr:carboxypeptidase regulatory-like domain-containing protein [Pyrinomonadaceae bacterium]
MVGFLVLAVLAAAVVSTLSFAQGGKKLRTKLVPKPAPAAPTKRAAREAGPERERRERRRNSAQNKSLPRPARPKGDRSPVKLSPREHRLKAGRPFNGDVRNLPKTKLVRREKPEREAPEVEPAVLGEPSAVDAGGSPSAAEIERSAPAPGPLMSFAGLDRANWGSGSPPDPVGDVGPAHYVQAVNSSVGIYDKATGALIAAFTLDTLMSQGSHGNLCDTDNYGDPIVLYDTFEDRWVITDFAFKLDAQGSVINPPGSFQCIAVSKSGDPVAGGWNFYSINTEGGLGDYPKFGVWPDGLYMTTNMFDYEAFGFYQNPRAYAFNKAQMYAGSPSVQVVSFDLPYYEFTVLPSNARLQTGTPPPGTPNYCAVVWQYLNVISFYKFSVNWEKISLSTMTGPFDSFTPTTWANPPSSVGQSGTTQTIDTLPVRLMMQNQYTNLGGVESLWNTHTVRGATSSQAAVRFYEVNVTGGAVAPTTAQAETHAPDSTNRFMPSLAVDRAGNMALGYSASSTSIFPAIRYAGRVASDPPGTLSLTEQTLHAGTGSQTGIKRWGDYAAMTLDPNGCTFWLTAEHYTTTGGNWQTRIGAFQFPQCTPAGSGAVAGQVTAQGGGPLSGATVKLGSRSTTTDASGNYSFNNIPAGTYPVMTASHPGRTTATVSSVVVVEAATTVQNFSLPASQASACLVDTTQADFQNGVTSNVDLNWSPGDILLAPTTAFDHNVVLSNQGDDFSETKWLGQTFVAPASGPLTRIDLNLFSLDCDSAPMPSVTVSVRNASGDLPTGADLATATIPGVCNGAGGFFAATFSSSNTVTLNAGTQYALVWRASSALPAGSPAPGYYATVSPGSGAVTTQNPYAGGRRVTSTDGGASWDGAAGNANNDHGFRVYQKNGNVTSGNLVSGAKDANPAAGTTPTWGAISWSATTPAGTSVKFQAAASNSPNGPFNYVGPDGTAATFFANGGSLSQFDGSRYLKYKALLSGPSSASPTLSDVTVCFSNQPTTAATTLTAAPAEATYGGAVNLSATLTDGASGVAGKTIAFTLNGASVGTADTDANGVATLADVSAAGISAGSYPDGVGASFEGGAGLLASSGSADFDVLSATFAATMTSSRNPVPVGLNFSYRIGVTNTGQAPATSLTMVDQLPSQVTFNRATPSQGSCSFASATRTVTCDLGTLTPGSSATVVISVKARQEGTLNNTATFTSPQWDPATGNNTASVNGLQAVNSADLSVKKTDSVDPVAVGETTTYTMTVKNAGPSVATGVTLTDALPAGMTFVSATTSRGTLSTPAVGSGGTVTADLGSMGLNATATVTVTVAVTTHGKFTNTATVTGNESDLDTADNTAKHGTTAFTLLKLLLSSQSVVGGCEPYPTGTLYLTGPAPAGGVTVTLSSTISGASPPPSILIPAGATASAPFTVTTSPVAASQAGVIQARLSVKTVGRSITVLKGGCP